MARTIYVTARCPFPPRPGTARHRAAHLRIRQKLAGPAIRTLLLPLLRITFAPSVDAHTLGIDKAGLIEMKDGSYHLVSHVPPVYQPMISAPELPPRCAQEGNPRGARGAYEVRFIFTCESALSASDVIVITLKLAEYLAGSGSIWAGAKRYTLLGIEHILVGIDHLLFVLALLFFNVGVEIGQLIFVFAVLAVLALLRYGAGISRDSTVFLRAERVVVYVIGMLASYWLIERGLAILPLSA